MILFPINIVLEDFEASFKTFPVQKYWKLDFWRFFKIVENRALMGDFPMSIFLFREYEVAVLPDTSVNRDQSYQTKKISNLDKNKNNNYDTETQYAKNYSEMSV